MDNTRVSIAEAKAHLSELVDRVAHGEAIVVTKRGRPVVRLSAPEVARRAVDLTELRRLTASVQPQAEDAGSFMRRVREESRY